MAAEYQIVSAILVTDIAAHKPQFSELKTQLLKKWFAAGSETGCENPYFFVMLFGIVFLEIYASIAVKIPSDKIAETTLRDLRKLNCIALVLRKSEPR